jgi:hypothetical protein
MESKRISINTKDTKTTGEIILNVNEKDISLTFPLTDPARYKKAVETVNLVQGIGLKSSQIRDNSGITEEEKGKTLLLHLCKMIETYQDMVKFTIGSELYTKDLEPIAQFVPFETWEVICAEIISQYTAFFASTLDTEGKL